MEVGTDAPHVTLVHDLSNHAIDVEQFGEEAIVLSLRCEQFSHDHQVAILAPGHLEQVLADMEWR